MTTALVATLANPSWWLLALAAFLVRGGLVVILLPIIALPTVASLTTTFAPILQVLVLGRSSIEGVVLAFVVASGILGVLVLAGLVGSWLDLALVREVARDEDIELRWRARDGFVQQALAIRLTAHLPTLFALGYASVRLVAVGYEEFTAPGDSFAPVEMRILARAPDAMLVVLAAWLFGETVGPLAARRSAAGLSTSAALLLSARQLLGPRGLATAALTTIALAALSLPFLLATSRAWEHVRASLLGDANPLQMWAAIVVLISTWVLGLALLGAGLAWRATAWTAEIAPPMVRAPETGAVPATPTDRSTDVAPESVPS